MGPEREESAWAAAEACWCPMSSRPGSVSWLPQGAAGRACLIRKRVAMGVPDCLLACSKKVGGANCTVQDPCARPRVRGVSIFVRLALDGLSEHHQHAGDEYHASHDADDGHRATSFSVVQCFKTQSLCIAIYHHFHLSQRV